MEESPDNPDQQGLFDDEIRRSETIDPEEQDD